MMGYVDFSRSENSAAAIRDGRMPATAAAKLLCCKIGAVKALLTPSEWHHTSKCFNKSDHYDVADLLAVSRGEVPADPETDRTELEFELARLRAWRPERTDAVVIENANVTWVAYEGRCARHRRATPYHVAGVRVTIRGATATVEIPAGSAITRNSTKRTTSVAESFQKRLATRGFRINGRLAEFVQQGP